MPTTTDAPATKPVRSRYEIERAERHCEVEARSRQKRMKRGAPRRDDVARIALFILLMQYRRERHASARREMWKTLTGMLGDAGYDAEAAGAVFDAMIPRVGLDLDRYLMGRRVDGNTRNTWRRVNGLSDLPNRSAAEQE